MRKAHYLFGYVLVQKFSPQHTMVCVDDGEQLVGLVDRIDEPPLGAKVRMQPLYGTSAHWGFKVLATLGCGLSIRFDDDHVESGWVDRLKNCLHEIREREVALRLGFLCGHHLYLSRPSFRMVFQRVFLPD